MEMRIVPYKPAESPQFNYDELKAWLKEQLAKYESAIYTDEQIKDAKTDRAALNKLRKAMNDERIRLEREYLQPFSEFKAKVNELIDMVDKPVGLIDAQVRDFDERRKAEKRKQIEAYWYEVLAADKVPAGIEFRRIFNVKWLNASISMSFIEGAIDEILAKTAEDLKVIRALPHYAYEAEQTYLSTLDLAKAVGEAHRLQEMAERKAAYEVDHAKRMEEHALKAEQTAFRSTPSDADIGTYKDVDGTQQRNMAGDQRGPKTWLSFKALLSVDDALALREFFVARSIEFEAL